MKGSVLGLAFVLVGCGTPRVPAASPGPPLPMLIGQWGQTSPGAKGVCLWSFSPSGTMDIRSFGAAPSAWLGGRYREDKDRWVMTLRPVKGATATVLAYRRFGNDDVLDLRSPTGKAIVLHRVIAR